MEHWEFTEGIVAGARASDAPGCKTKAIYSVTQAGSCTAPQLRIWSGLAKHKLMFALTINCL
jgi:hypothetical protein